MFEPHLGMNVASVCLVLPLWSLCARGACRAVVGAEGEQSEHKAPANVFVVKISFDF